jgi:N-acetylglucosamine kinase-like BadF-type ATPase
VHVLGVDVGGSHCQWRRWPGSGGDGRADVGAQPAVQGVEAAAEVLARVLRTAQVETAAAAVLAVAGAGDARIAAALAQALAARGIAVPLAVVTDVLAAAVGALGSSAGLLVWSGTGSFAVARAADGALIRAGGRGFLLGDQGSGYDLVRRAAAAAVLAVDGLGPPTALGAALASAFGAAGPAHLGAALQRFESGAVADRLDVVLAVAAAGDAVAQAVLADGIAALAALAGAALRSAGVAGSGLSAVLGGGVLTAVPSLQQELVQRLRSFGIEQVTVAAADAGAVGAAMLADGWRRRQPPWPELVAARSL